MAKQALLIIDLQNEYLPSGKLPLVGIHEAVDKAAQILAEARKKNITVIHVRHEFIDANVPFFKPNTAAVEIQEAVAPLESETVIVKNEVNAFKGTQLKSLLDTQGVTELTIIGAMSHMCIDAAVRAAADYGYRVTVIHDACATRDLEFNGTTAPAAAVQTAMMAAFEFGYATVMSTQDYLQQLSAH